jgi:hypothetical protein
MDECGRRKSLFKDAAPAIGLVTFQFAAVVTFAFLTFFDGYEYTAWNWLVAVPVNIFLSEIWPIYWALSRWLPTPG